MIPTPTFGPLLFLNSRSRSAASLRACERAESPGQRIRPEWPEFSVKPGITPEATAGGMRIQPEKTAREKIEDGNSRSKYKLRNHNDLTVRASLNYRTLGTMP